MKHSLYFDELRKLYLVYDDLNNTIVWDKNKSDKISYRPLQKFSSFIFNKSITVNPNDIEVIYVSGKSIKIVNNNSGGYTLVDGNKLLGTFTDELLLKDLDALTTYGGIIILKSDFRNKQLVFATPIYNTYNTKKDTQRKKQTSNTDTSTLTPSPTTEYINAMIKIPKDYLHHDDIKKIIDFNVQILKKVNEIYMQMKNINANENLDITNNIYQEKLMYQEKVQILEEKIHKLMHDRSHLENEIENSQLIAHNNLISKLKFSRAAINRHTDLEDLFPFKEMIANIVRNTISLVNDKNIKDYEIEQVINDSIKELSDNIDSKIQSLQEIKKEFIINKIL